MSKDMKAGAAPVAASVPQSEVESLRAKVAELEAKLGVKSAPLREKTSGTFRLTQPMYSKGVYHLPGELVTITDEVPGKTWVRVEAEGATPAPPPAPPAPEKPTRAADKSVV